MQKNVASQKLILYAFDSTTNLPKTGDAANITPYVSKDYGAVTAITDTSATEMDSTNAKGYYVVDLTQAETNADTLLFSGKSSTANIVVLAMPAVVFTTPPNFSKAVIDASGLIDANAVKVGPTGSGTAQTAGDLKGSLNTIAGYVDTEVAAILAAVDTEVADIQSRLPAALGANGNMKSDARDWIGTALGAADTAGYPKVTVKNGTGTGEISLSSGGVAVRGNVKKAAAFPKFPILMTDSTNHAPATGKTVTVTILKDATGGFGALNSGDTVTEVSDGIYEVDLDGTDTNANTIVLQFTAPGCDTTFERIVTSV